MSTISSVGSSIFGTVMGSPTVTEQESVKTKEPGPSVLKVILISFFMKTNHLNENNTFTELVEMCRIKPS